MSTFELDENRDRRISAEVIADAYTDEEQTLNWYYYLESKLKFPFQAKWLNQKSTSSPTDGEDVEVLEMSNEDDCTEDMFVEVLYTEGKAQDIFSVPLSEIQAVEADDATQEAIADWKYWVGKGYHF
jgi:hypothetical protein